MSKRKFDKKQYVEFCSNANNLQVYDGRGTYDLYECDTCKRGIVTTYAVKGVTPFTMRCPKCSGMMTHTKTFRLLPYQYICIGYKVLKWVRPTFEQYCRMTRPLQEHIENGGLVLETNLS